MRVATLNLWVTNGVWEERSAALRAGLRELRPDVIGFQEVIEDADHDTAAEILGPGYEVRHQAGGLLGDGNCAAIASRWPVAGWHEVEVEELVAERARHVVLAGDLDATPEAASIRFLRGLQSLDGTSVHYHDAWERTHPDDPGHTFTTRNPLMTEQTDVRVETSRRIDYIFVRCDERGPTLAVRRCDLIFDRPVDGVWATDHFGLVADLEPP